VNQVLEYVAPVAAPTATAQVDVRNVTDRLNVVNFSGLFSGTQLAPGRQLTVQLKTRF
jgi:hypothetical protein